MSRLQDGNSSVFNLSATPFAATTVKSTRDGSQIDVALE
jgi:hypothetical protein